MKILVCTDGSEYSQKALAEAAKIAGGCNADEVAVIHVYDHGNFPFTEATSLSQIERLNELEAEQKEERKKILADALKYLEGNNIKATSIFKEGHPADIITSIAAENGYDMIVMGSRGMGGLKKLFLGSISGAVIHEANTNVLTVK